MTRSRRAFALFMVVAILFSSFDADARRRRRRRSRGPKVVAEKPLIDRMGGRKTLEAVIDDFMKRASQDPRLSETLAKWSGSKTKSLRGPMVDKLCQAAGGPCRYSGPSADSIRKSADLRDEEFLAAAESLSDALDEKHVAEREKNELLAIVGSIRSEIVSDASSSAGSSSAGNF